jgi:hypothetical protein
MTPSGMRGVLNDAVSIHFADVSLGFGLYRLYARALNCM